MSPLLHKLNPEGFETPFYTNGNFLWPKKFPLPLSRWPWPPGPFKLRLFWLIYSVRVSPPLFFRSPASALLAKGFSLIPRCGNTSVLPEPCGFRLL